MLDTNARRESLALRPEEGNPVALQIRQKTPLNPPRPLALRPTSKREGEVSLGKY